MSGQLKNDTKERKLRVTLLSVGWKASCNGDLTTINRELAIQMAKHPNVEVSVFLPWCSEEDKKDADGYNVKLIEAVKLPGLKPVLWLASVPDGHAMDCVLGHGVDLGQQIPLIKRNPNYSNCRWIQVVHTVPEEIGMYKSISEGQQMQQTEIELCKMADQVVTIGPKLTDAYKHQIRKPDIFNLTPGILSEFSDIQQASDEERKFHVLVTESGNSEDFYVKGYDIAAKAIAEVKDKSYQLKFASKQRGKEDELANKLLQCGIGRNQLMICSFDENRETLANLFSAVNIAILPSKTEGFGLSSLQAISAGLPVLVSGNSGIAEALRKVPTGSQCIVDSEDPAEWARAIKAVRHKERKVRLAEARILRENYSQQFSWEKPCNFLVEKMYSLAFGASSSEFHSISSTSESPHKQEELKKWKQKMKIVKTEKMKGTSPLTVKPTTGHVKELIEKEQGRKDTNRSSSMLDVSTPLGDFETLVTAEIRSYMMKGTSEFLKEKLDTWRKTEFHIAVTGVSGTGKSSFVNAIRGLADHDDRAAKVGVVETTFEPTSFDHPQNPNIKIWDLPGLGTKTNPDLETYCKKVQFDEYHTFLIFSCTRITKNDVMLAQEIRKQGKSFFFILTKIDQEYQILKRKKSFNEANMLRDIRTRYLKSLNYEGNNAISGEDIFLISNHHPRKWDFDRLTHAILDALPRYQRESLILSLDALTSSSREILRRKVDIFRGRMWIVAVTSAGVAGIPIPGVSYAVDIALVTYEINQLLAQLGIPKEGSQMFEILGDTTKKQVVSLYLNFASAAGIASFFVKEASSAVAAEEVARFIPYIGLAIAGTLSFASTLAVLRVALNRIEAVALAVLEDAAQRSVDDFDFD